MSELWEWALHFSDRLDEAILDLVSSIWIYPALFAVSLIDAIFPVVPSESVIIGAAAAWTEAGEPNLVIVFFAGAIGAWCGDQITYTVGTKVDIRKYRVFRRPRIIALIEWAERSLEHRGTLYIIAGRFIPMGRVAVNLTAGMLRFPRRRFMGVAAIATSVWAGWALLIGVVFGALVEGNVFLSILVGVTGGILVGLLVDRLLRAFGLQEPELPDLTEGLEPVGAGDDVEDDEDEAEDGRNG